jgi:hypothetical protein
VAHAEPRDRNPRTPGTDETLSLDPFDGREPGGCAVVVVSGLNPVGFDGGRSRHKPDGSRMVISLQARS